MQWLEDQLNRIILSRILKMRMLNKMSQSKISKTSENKVEADIQKMDAQSKISLFLIFIILTIKTNVLGLEVK